ncbi:MAG TPA: ferrous iron transporter B, partial [Labilithrix sp.]
MTAKLRDIDSDAPASRRARAAKRPLVVALVGRPNSGKSSLYNAVTGGNAHVGNYPGITVEILEGQAQLADGTSIAIADLPGFYSVEATVDTGTDEGVARAFLDALKKDDARDHVVVQVADATRLGLALRLTRELVHAGVPLVVALTHADVIEREGRTIDTAALGDAIGAPVVLVNARKPAAKLAVLAAVEQVSSLTARAENLSFDPAELARTVVRDVGTEREKTRRKVTERIDRVLLHPLIGPVLFVSIMAALFAAVFLVADPASAVMDRVIGLVRAKVTSTFGRNLATSFFVDGILGGAGTVLAFMPQIVILTVALELLEASGYLARGAFLVDRLLRLLGLSGRSFLPLLMAHACAVPAVQATRVIRDPRERLTTILVLPFMSCSARLPTYGLVIATFFAARSAFFKAGVFVSLYFAGMLTALLASLVLRRTATKGRGLPLVLEMPSYRVPQASVVARKAARSATRFLRDVGT